jgi:hypothetical protein
MEELYYTMTEYPYIDSVTQPRVNRGRMALSAG